MARIIAMPEGTQAPEGMTERITGANGKTLLPETTAGSYGDRHQAPARRRPPLVQLHQHVERAVLVAFGIPTPLLPSSMANGVAKRESMRALRVRTLKPLGLLIAEELAATGLCETELIQPDDTHGV